MHMLVSQTDSAGAAAVGNIFNDNVEGLGLADSASMTNPSDGGMGALGTGLTPSLL